jgi:putative glutamine amidotransferase
MVKPLMIGVLCDEQLIENNRYHTAGEEYVDAVVKGMGAIALLLPAVADNSQAKAVLSTLDGLLLPGASSNIDPVHYAAVNEEEKPVRDPARDSTAFALIHEAVAIGLPLFGICRGFQEINVALGGSLHQRVQTIPSMRDHRSNDELPLDQQYADIHTVDLVAGGLIAAQTAKQQVQVNSLHQQGIHTLADRLKVEAVADDGLIEAYSLKNIGDNDKGFVLAVQWHPEWQVLENPFNLSLFDFFKQACLAFQKR